jgi:cell division protein ZapA (FtsZ GTPase activity inhibitor)
VTRGRAGPMNSIVVDLLSRKIPIKTEDTEEHIRSLVKYIEGKLDEIDSDHRLPEMTRSILALLNITDDLFKEKKRVRELRDAIRTKSTFLLEKIDQNRYLC